MKQSNAYTMQLYYATDVTHLYYADKNSVLPIAPMNVRKTFSK